MTHRQHPLGSGFPPSATAADVLAGIDMSSRNAIVTGGHGGIGLEVTCALAGAGASLLVGARDPAYAAAALDGVPGVTIDRLDLVDPLSIDAFADRWLATGRPLHRALLPALRAAGRARVVNVSSGAHRAGRIRWDDPNFTSGFDSLAAYAQSKTANVLFTVGLDERWAGDGIRGYAAHPGVVAGTKLNSAAGESALRRMGLIDNEGRPIIDPWGGKKTPAQGASTIVFAATNPLLDDVGGVYLVDNDIAPLNDEERTSAGAIPTDATSRSIDPDDARRLWTLSEQLLQGNSSMGGRRRSPR